MANRYCSNCGHELSEDASFCSSCGRPVHETAHVPTPDTDVPVPPPPSTQQQAEAPPPRRSTANKVLLFGCLGLGLVAVLVVIVVGAAVVTSSGGGGGEPVAGAGGGGSQALDNPPTIVCEVGNPCDLGESTLTITKADKTDLISTSFANEEGNFFVVEFDYTYGGDQPANIGDYALWKLEDGKGRTYNYADETTSNYEIDNNRYLLYDKVNPGIKKKGAMVFEVAPDANDFTLHVKDLIRPQTSKRAEIYI